MTAPSFVIGIAGGNGVGKTTAARFITENVGESATRIPVDNYYESQNHLDVAEREQMDCDHPPALEWDPLYEQLLELMEERAVEMPQYGFEVHSRRSERETVEPTDVIILEGILAFCDENVNEILGLRLCVETDADVHILRRVQRDAIGRGRDLQRVINQYPPIIEPMHEQFIEPTEKHADLIIPEGANSVVVTLLEEKVQVEIEGDETHIWERDAVEREIQVRASSHGSGN